MAEESDGIAEAFDGQLRVALTAAGRVGEVLARMREDAVRRAQAASEQQARELSSRFDAERLAARAELGNVYRPDWWDNASPEQIGQAYTTARAWSGEEPEAVRAEGRIRDEVRERYGVDVANTGADPDAVLTAVRMSVAQEDVRLSYEPSGRRGGLSEEVDVFRQQADTERHRGAAEEAEAVNLITTAEAADRSANAAHAAAQPEPGETRITLTAEELSLVQDGLRRNATDAERYTTEQFWEGQEPEYDLIDSKTQEAESSRSLSERLGSEQAAGQTSTLSDVEVGQVREGLDRTVRAADHEVRPERWGADMPPEHDYIDAKEAEAASARKLSDGISSAQAQQAETRSQGAQAAAHPLYDSADRRRATAANLEGKGIDADTVATRMRADVSQGRPATEAVAGAASKRAPKARANRSRGAQAQRGDVSR